MAIVNMTNRTQVVFNNIPRIAGDIRNLGRIVSKVGFPKEGRVGSPVRAGSGSPALTQMKEMAERAFTLEFGPVGPKGKSWPFMTQAFLEGMNQLKRESAKQYEKVVRNTVRPISAMSTLGQLHTAQIKDKIKMTRTPTLEPLTITLKNSDKPLEDTGQMLNSVQHKEVVR